MSVEEEGARLMADYNYLQYKFGRIEELKTILCRNAETIDKIDEEALRKMLVTHADDVKKELVRIAKEGL